MDSLGSLVGILRALVRSPLVHVRLLVETPEAWIPVAIGLVLLAIAWALDRHRAADVRMHRRFEILVGIAGAAFLVWFVHGGSFPWTEGDWREEWVFFSAWKEALLDGRLPYYLTTTMQGTERYFANLQTPLMPYSPLLAPLSVNVFVTAHLSLVFAVGFAGLVRLRRFFDLAALPWLLLVILFTLNGHIVAHLSAGHLPWVAYYLMPWVFVAAVTLVSDERSGQVFAFGAAVFGGMILIGGWHVFMWSLLFVNVVTAVSSRPIATLAGLGVATVLLVAVRLFPGVVTFGGGTNTFMGGFDSVGAMLTSLVDVPPESSLFDKWELDTYVGYGGVALICLGLVPFAHKPWRRLNRMLWPSALLAVLAYRSVYGMTLFRLPGFVSERVATRFLIVPVLWLIVVGTARFSVWWRRQTQTWTTAGTVWLASAFLWLQLMLRAHSWRPHAGDPSAVLPSGIVKPMPVEAAYWWAFWIGVVTTAVVATALGRSLWLARSGQLRRAARINASMYADR